VALAVTALRFLLAWIFLAASLSKMIAWPEFRAAVATYELLPERIVTPVASLVPSVEAACGLALLLGAGLPLAGLVSGCLLVLFAIAMALNLIRGRQIDCGCGGPGVQRRIGWHLVGRNAALAAVGFALAAAPPTGGTIEQLPWPTHEALAAPGGSIPAIAIAAALALLLTALTTETVRLRRIVGRHPFARSRR